jgi:hexokinase
MQSIKDKTREFFKSHSLDCGTVDIEKSCELFIEEMKIGLDGESSSLAMIPTYIEMGKKIPVNKPVIVIDAGGTSLRRAVVSFNDNYEPIIEDYEKCPMPGTDKAITDDEFFNIIAAYLQPVIHKSDTIAFCFSFTTESLPNKDARVTMLGKQIKIDGLLGEMLGERLVKELGVEKKVIILNDSVASLLGGTGLEITQNLYDYYIGFILGTGTNTCYLESCKNIGKLKPYENDGQMIISMESGGYANFKRSDIDKEFDDTTNDPGVFKFEKIIGGKYEGGLFLTILNKAVEEGLFSENFRVCQKKIETLPSAGIDSFISSPFGENILAKCCESSISGDDDRATLYYLIDLFYERSALLIFINFASIMIKSGRGKNPCRPVCIVIEGSTILNSEMLKQKLNYFIKKYLNDRFNIYCKFVKVDNVNMIGTAIAGLTN